MTTYSVIGPLTGVTLPPLDVVVDVRPVIEAMGKVEAAVRDCQPVVHVNVPVPSVAIQERPIAPPIVDVHVPAPIVNLTLPEMPPPPVTVNVAPGRMEVTVQFPYLRTIILANIILSVLVIAMAAYELVVQFGFVD